MVQILKFDTPTDLYLVGSYIDDDAITEETEKRKHGITDDYHSIDVVFGSIKKYFDTAGFYYILTKEELENFIAGENFQEKDGYDVLIFKGFVGTISVKVTTKYEGKDIDILDEYDPNEYLMYQEKMRDRLEQLGDGPMDFYLIFDGEGSFEEKPLDEF